MRLLPFLLLVIFAQVASAHPGKTDYQDGHKCLKNCGDWDLSYSEYHLHDKDGNPIRVERKKKPLSQPASAKKAGPEPSIQEVVAAPMPLSPEPLTDERRSTVPSTVVVQGYSMPVTEGWVLTAYDIILLGVAGLLLLVLVFVRRRRD